MFTLLASVDLDKAYKNSSTHVLPAVVLGHSHDDRDDQHEDVEQQRGGRESNGDVVSPPEEQV